MHESVRLSAREAFTVRMDVLECTVSVQYELQAGWLRISCIKKDML